MNKFQNTYCNPIPLPEYPLGRDFFTGDTLESFRETADPTVLYNDGKWYLYSSCKIGYVSEDFITWKHIHIDPPDIGYAPSVVKHNGRFWLAASHTQELYVADKPEGPFEFFGNFMDIDGNITSFFDPMMFSDDDGRLYIYAGDMKEKGIVGAEIDAQNPNQLISPVKKLIRFNPENKWECLGEWNQNRGTSWMEGPYMYKHSGTYYLTYCAPGTAFSTYAMGAYKSKSPLDGFAAQKNNPFISKKYGIVRGPGHGCIVDGPNDTIWAFYTCTLSYAYKFERRIGMDCVHIDANGDLCVKNVTEIPQWQPGLVENQASNNDAGLLPLTFRERTTASSFVYGREPLYATDDSMLTFWEPQKSDKAPSLMVDFKWGAYQIATIRIIWRDIGMDIGKNILPGPFKYTVEAYTLNNKWEMALDMSENTEDMTIDYRVLKQLSATKVRLNILGSPDRITPGVISFCVFGEYIEG